MGKFILKSVTDLSQIRVGTEIQESDYSQLADGKFYQYEHVAEEQESFLEAKPGLYRIEVENYEPKLIPTVFNQEPVLEDYVHTETVTSKIDKFFSKIHVYEEYGIFPKRGCLLYGSQGTGKSLIITKAVNKYLKDNDVFVLVWNTDKYEARHIKAMLQKIRYTDAVKKMILVAEDIGGVEYQGGAKMPSQSSMLSLLDNVERTFTIPTLILATTNFPESLLENLTNRPQRFDDVVHVGNPSAEFRAKFLEFFSKNTATKEEIEEIKNKKYGELSVAHIKEVVIRAKIYDISILESMQQVTKQSTRAKKENFQEATRSMGFGFSDE